MSAIDITQILEDIIQKRDADNRVSPRSTKTMIARVSVYNVADTKDEAPPSGEGPNWDDYWKLHTGDTFPTNCASCGRSIGRPDRKGAHIRFVDDKDNTMHAWIAIFCSSCNQRKGLIPLLEWAKVVETTMSTSHPNYK